MRRILNKSVIRLSCSSGGVLSTAFVFGQPVLSFTATFTMQVALGWPLEDFASAAKAALDVGSVDVVPLQKLARARQLSTVL